MVGQGVRIVDLVTDRSSSVAWISSLVQNNLESLLVGNVSSEGYGKSACGSWTMIGRLIPWMSKTYALA